MADFKQKQETIRGTLKECGNKLKKEIAGKDTWYYISNTVIGSDGEEYTGEQWNTKESVIDAIPDLVGKEVEYTYTKAGEKSAARVNVYPIKTEKEKADYKAKSGGGGGNWGNSDRFLWEKERAAHNDVRIEWQEIFNDIAPFYVEMYKNKSAQDTSKLIDCAPYIKLAVEKTSEVQASFSKEA